MNGPITASMLYNLVACPHRLSMDLYSGFSVLLLAMKRLDRMPKSVGKLSLAEVIRKHPLLPSCTVEMIRNGGSRVFA